MRHDPYGFLNNRPDSLQDDWDSLLNKLQSLISVAQSAGRKDLLLAIVRQINVLVKNKPNKKIYRSVLNTTKNIESELNDRARTR
jgi:hypothetical protein